MEVYATGFNAWSQLEFDDNKDKPYLPEDFYEFKKVFEHDHFVKLWASLSATNIKTKNKSWMNESHGCRTAGFQDCSTDLVNGILLSLTAVSGNDKRACYQPDAVAINEYASDQDYRIGKTSHTYVGLGEITQIVSYEAGFGALNTGGEVYTWGDPRYPACLGRYANMTSGLATPSLVTDLVGLPTGKITKIAAGGYLMMALTENNDLYGWGGHPGQPILVEGLSQDPSPIVVEDNDIVDFAVGTSHVIVVTKSHELFVIGENANGQLGLPNEKNVASWTKVPFTLEPGKSISGVVCGPRNTFVIVRKH